MHLFYFDTADENADENAIMYDDNNNNSTSLVKPEASLPDFSEDMIKVTTHGIT